MRENRLLQTSPQETDVAHGVTGSLGLIYIPIKRNTYTLCSRNNHPYKYIERLYFTLGKK